MSVQINRFYFFKEASVNIKLISLKGILIAFAFVLTAPATVAHAQEANTDKAKQADKVKQTAARKASCEQQRLTCQKDWAQINSVGVPVTPPDKTKLCWNGFYACVK